MDPFSQFDDASLWDALRRAHLISNETSTPLVDERGVSEDNTLDEFSRTRFSLDTIIESEGANLSVGERSLLSLARALVKNSRVIVLDEATYAVLFTCCAS